MKNILIIEDERTFANIVGELIQDQGFSCIVTYSAADAEIYFPKLKTEIQIVILDLMMRRSGSFAGGQPYAGETGDEVYDKIRTLAPTMPIIVMTAKAKENLKQRYFTDKYTNLFFKPISPDMITNLIEILKKL